MDFNPDCDVEGCDRESVGDPKAPGLCKYHVKHPPSVIPAGAQEEAKAAAEWTLELLADYFVIRTRHSPIWLIRDEKLRSTLEDIVTAHNAALASLRSEIDALRRERDEQTRLIQSAYRKHHLGQDNIGWNELSDRMCDTLCNVMGDTAFQKWLEEQTEDGK